MNIFTTLFLSFCLFSCNSSPNKITSEVKLVPSIPQDSSSLPKVVKAFDFKYDLKSPSKSFDLHKSLEEISGLSMTLDSNLICAIQDENGFLFYINKNTGKIDKKIKFHKDGDYEGVETVGNEVFVVKSTGTLYQVQELEVDSPKIVKHKSFLNKKYEVEGLCYDQKKSRLLLACKSKAGEGKLFKLKKAVYSFDLKQKRLEPMPAFIISLEKIQDFLKTTNEVKEIHRFDNYFDPKQKELAFCPSAIAVHPISGNFYLLSTINKTLIILSEKGDIVHMVKLSKKVHRQPEGITFDTDGTLYISNEGKGGTSQLHRFVYQQNK